MLRSISLRDCMLRHPVGENGRRMGGITCRQLPEAVSQFQRQP
jgi:hypothetical protein